MPVQLYKMGSLNNNKYWKCKKETVTYIHAHCKSTKFLPFGEIALKYLGRWLGEHLPLSPWVCLLEDKTEIPQIKMSQQCNRHLDAGKISYS